LFAVFLIYYYANISACFTGTTLDSNINMLSFIYCGPAFSVTPVRQ